jgi:beta-lactamase superfamily II metal-dependent hydrolase
LSTSATTLSIVDVGHGNCAVLVDTNGVLVIDAGPGSSLLEFLKQEGIAKVDVVLISHADKDHIEGLIGLIAAEEFAIDRVRINSDALKPSALWDDLLYSLNKAHLAGDLEFNTALTVADTGNFDQGEVHVEILAPNLYIAGKGPGSTDRAGRELTSNSVSAVVRLVKDGNPIAIFTGDIDDIGLDSLIETGLDCKAHILIFPHHGGRAGAADMSAFAHKLFGLVAPQTVIFSIGRAGKFNNPRPEIVAAVRDSLPPEVRVACTQLSTRCAANVPTSEPTHLTEKFARGRSTKRCCGGTFVVEMGQPGTLLPTIEDHLAFISANAETALCRDASKT